MWERLLVDRHVDTLGDTPLFVTTGFRDRMADEVRSAVQVLFGNIAQFVPGSTHYGLQIPADFVYSESFKFDETAKQLIAAAVGAAIVEALPDRMTSNHRTISEAHQASTDGGKQSRYKNELLSSSVSLYKMYFRGEDCGKNASGQPQDPGPAVLAATADCPVSKAMLAIKLIQELPDVQAAAWEQACWRGTSSMSIGTGPLT